MCTNPILIKNRKYKHIDAPLRGSYIEVPCGVCDECLQRRCNDLYVRARYEYDACLRSGGIGFMCCLTYSDETLPYLVHDGKRYMVFNKLHVINFIKRLRTRLDRIYKKDYNSSAPDFKYLITCEYGTDPSKTHRPHYHLLFFFNNFISPSLFRNAFFRSIFVEKDNNLKSVFGIIHQCDVLDPKRGGIKYCGKYVLKDLMFEHTSKIIRSLIRFNTEKVSNEFNLFLFPKNYEEEFHNKCVRSSKEYKQAIVKYVRPYRHMLQFYMCSNDLGVSAIIKKYGDGIINLPCLNFEGFPFALPKQVKARFERDYGTSKADELSKSVFLNFLESCLSVLREKNFLSYSKSSDLLEFARTYIQPFSGSLLLVNPEGYNFRDFYDNNSLVPFDLFIDSCNFFHDNGFYELRSQLLYYLKIYDSKENREFRASIARRRKEENEKKYKERRFNNPYKLF